MRPSRLIACAAVALCGLTACGPSSSKSHSDPNSLLMAAVTKATTQSVHLDGTITGTMSGTGDFASIGSLQFTINLKLDKASATTASGTMTMHISGRSVDATFVLTNGTEYVSTDGGATWKTITVNIKDSSLNAPLAYLGAIGTVTDTGASTYNGTSVETYHATVDPAKALAFLKNALSGAGNNGASLTQLLTAITFKSGSLDVALNNQGQIVHDRGNIVASLNASAVQAGATGTMTIQENIDCSFTNYGEQITVTPPPNAG